jgi:hypothetical protein
MTRKLIGILGASVSRLLGLVDMVAVVWLPHENAWGIRITDPWFSRLLRRDAIHSNQLIRGCHFVAQRPATFRSRRAAIGFAKYVRLWPMG